MNRIYESALATIVAVSGEDCEAGLPGVSVVPRSKQPSAIAGGRLLILTLPHITYFLERSKYSTRG